MRAPVVSPVVSPVFPPYSFIGSPSGSLTVSLLFLAQTAAVATFVNDPVRLERQRLESVRHEREVADIDKRLAAERLAEAGAEVIRMTGVTDSPELVAAIEKFRAATAVAEHMHSPEGRAACEEKAQKEGRSTFWKWWCGILAWLARWYADCVAPFLETTLRWMKDNPWKTAALGAAVALGGVCIAYPGVPLAVWDGLVIAVPRVYNGYVLPAVPKILANPAKVKRLLVAAGAPPDTVEVICLCAEIVSGEPAAAIPVVPISA